MFGDDDFHSDFHKQFKKDSRGLLAGFGFFALIALLVQLAFYLALGYGLMLILQHFNVIG